MILCCYCDITCNTIITSQANKCTSYKYINKINDIPIFVVYIINIYQYLIGVACEKGTGGAQRSDDWPCMVMDGVPLCIYNGSHT